MNLKTSYSTLAKLAQLVQSLTPVQEPWFQCPKWQLIIFLLSFNTELADLPE